MLLLTFIIGAIPMFNLAGWVRQYGIEIPSRDDWEMAPLIVKAHTGELRFDDIFAQQQEGRTVLPKLVFILSAAGGHWDVRDLMMLSVVLCVLTAVGLYFLLRRSGLSPVAVAICWWLSVLFICSPAQFELWLLAEGCPSFMPAFFIVASLCTIETRWSTAVKFAVCAVLAMASSFTVPNGLLAWGLTFPVHLLRGGTARWKSWSVAWLGACALCATGYFWGYSKPAYLPDFAPTVSLLDYARFILIFLGGGIAYASKDHTVALATAFGSLALALFLAAVGCIAARWRERQFVRRTLPWIALGGYSIGSAMLASLGRIGFGAAYALASRYVTFALYLTVADIALFAIIGGELLRTRPTLPRRAAVSTAALALISLYLFLHHLCFPRTLYFLRGGSANDRLARGAFLFSPVLDTLDVISRTNYPRAKFAREREIALDDHHLIRPPLIRTTRVEEIAHAAADGRVASGWGDVLRVVDAEHLGASGWAALNAKGRPADCVALAYRTASSNGWILFALSDAVQTRLEVTKRLHNKNLLWSGWEATFPRAAIPPGAQLSAWAVDADEPKLYQLRDHFPATLP